MMTQQPVSGVARHSLDVIRPQDMREVPLGVKIASLAPPLPMVICRLNGEWVLRETWEDITRPGDVIEWHPVPQDREDFRTIIAVASAVLSVIFPVAAPYLAAFNVAYNILVPPRPPRIPVQPPETEDAYSASLSGNVARIDQPIWKNCGHVEITPPYACEPYFETRPKPGEEDPELDRDQLFFALFAVGVGTQDVLAKIANTPLSRFQDVIVAQYLPPGTLPSMVNANVVSAPEVNSLTLFGATLDGEAGRYIGGFVACASRQTVDHIGIDVVATRGLGKLDSPLTVRWQVEWRPIDEFGRSLDDWSILATEVRTAFTATPQRWTNTYALPAGVRPEIRIARTDIQDTDPQALHEIAWTALRAYRNGVAPLNPHTGHFEVVMRASSQLSNQATQDFRMICDGYARKWAPESGWSAEEKTRNPMWWILELITSPVWGIGQPDERIDLQSFYEIALTCDERQDRFDFCFDSKIGAWDAMQMIARSCRSRVFRRNGVISIARDQLADLPVTAFTPRNCYPLSMKISETLPKETTPDGFIVQYRDRRTSVWSDIPCPCPGVALEDMVKPVYLRLDGVIGAIQAEREGRYEAANLVYRPQMAEWETEMQGTLPAYMSPVRFQPEIAQLGQSGDVVEWDEPSLVMSLSEPPDFTAAPLYLTLIRDDGTLTTPVQVYPGPTGFDVTLPVAPDFDLVLDDGMRERPKFLLGPVTAEKIVKVANIQDGGEEDGVQSWRLSGVIDDIRVHAADSDLLPGPGDEQDPIALPDSDAGGEYFPTVYLPPSDGLGSDWPGVAQAPPNPFMVMLNRLSFETNGLMHQVTQDYRYSAEEPFQHWDFPRSWLIGRPVDPSYAARYEIRGDIIGSYSPPAGPNYTWTGTTGTWLPLDELRVWELSTPNDPELPGAADITVRFQIRNAESLVVQDQFDYSFVVSNYSPGDGGGGDGPA